MFRGAAQPSVPTIGPADVPALIAAGALLVDIREQEEWDEARIPGAEFRPLSTIDRWWPQLPRDATVILYCRSGNRSAHAARALIQRAGLANVVHLGGGILAWAREGFELDR